MATSNKSKYAANQYLSETKKSDDKAVKLITFHLAQLKIQLDNNPLDPDYILMYNRTLPLALDAQNKYTIFFSTEGAQVGQTVYVTGGIKAIKGKTGKARDWYNRTSAVYAILNPARMAAIWNRGLKPFRGKMDNIIGALNTLSLAIGADTNPLMIAIKAEVDAEYADMNPARNTQLSAKGNTRIKSSDVKASCRLAMKMEYQNTGRIMDKFPDNTDNIQESFHDMALLLNKQQMVFNPTLNSHETIDLAKRTMVFNTKFRGVTTGGDAWIYLSSTAGGTDSTPVKIINGIPFEFTAVLFGITDYGVHCHITVVNQAGVKVSFFLQQY